MKKLIALLLCVLLMAGCSNKQPSEPTMAPIMPVAEEESNTYQETFDLISVSAPAVEEKYYLDDGTELFSYIGQHIQMIHPDEELADKIILDFLNRVDAALPDVENVYSNAQTEYNPDLPWYPYFYHILYNPTRIDNDVLSFMGTQSSYNGGMHSSICAISANYDMMTGDVLTWGSIMHEDADKEDFIEIILDKLAQLQEEYYLFDDYESAVNSRFGADENLYEDFFFTNSGLNFYFSPYEIAPYSSGIIKIEIPYHELPGLLHDGYFPPERDLIEGRMYFDSFAEINTEQFHNMTEVNLTVDEETIVIYPVGTVEDIRITVAGDGKSIPEYTVFASPKMSDKDAVVLNVSKEELQKYTIHYYSGQSNEQMVLTD